MGSRPHLGPAGLLSRQVMNLECRGRHVCLEPSGAKGRLKCPERRSRCCGRECSIARVCAQEAGLPRRWKSMDTCVGHPVLRTRL